MDIPMSLFGCGGQPSASTLIAAHCLACIPFSSKMSSDAQMNVGDTIETTSTAIHRHGFPLVLATFLTVGVSYFTWTLWQHQQMQTIENHRTTREQLKELNSRLDEERMFSRGKLIDTIDRNSEALEGLTNGLERH